MMEQENNKQLYFTLVLCTSTTTEWERERENENKEVLWQAEWPDVHEMATVGLGHGPFKVTTAQNGHYNLMDIVWIQMNFTSKQYEVTEANKWL